MIVAQLSQTKQRTGAELNFCDIGNLLCFDELKHTDNIPARYVSVKETFVY